MAQRCLCHQEPQVGPGCPACPILAPQRCSYLPAERAAGSATPEVSHPSIGQLLFKVSDYFPPSNKRGKRGSEDIHGEGQSTGKRGGVCLQIPIHLCTLHLSLIV